MRVSPISSESPSMTFACPEIDSGGDAQADGGAPAIATSVGQAIAMTMQDLRMVTISHVSFEALNIAQSSRRVRDLVGSS
jgi:hypothetical protein